MTKLVEAIVRVRRGTAATAAANNIVLKEGEGGLETDTRRLKFGDGVTAWNALPYATVAYSVSLETIGGLTPAADRLPYYTGASGAALATFTTFGRSLVDDADAAAGRATLGLGTTSTQNANAVNITGGSITGLSALTVVSATVVGIVANGGAGTSQGSYFQGQRAGVGSWFVGDVGLALGSGTGLMLYAYGSNPIHLHGTALMPDTDNAMSGGDASHRFSTIYAGTGTINTSDARDKCETGEVPDEWLDAWGAVQWSRFKFKEGTRWHVGLVAQQVRDAFAARGLDGQAIGLLCYDEWPAERAVRAKYDRKGNLIREARPGRPAGNRWGVRYSECQAMEAAWQRRELASLRAELAALKSAK